MKVKLKKLLIISIIIFSVIFIAVIITWCINLYENYSYNKIKKNEITKMADFIADKYDEEFTFADCIYYKEEDYRRHRDILGNGKYYNIPYVAVFEKDNEKITVVDRKGTISDDKQLKDLNCYIGGYFSSIVGADIDFVQIRKVDNGNIQDTAINEYIQNHFNSLVTDRSINEFVDGILKEDDLELIFYIKDSEDRDSLISKITTKLSYLENKENIKNVLFYLYDMNEELIVDIIESQLESDYYDEHKFNYYYVPNKYQYYSIDDTCNHYLVAGWLILDRGYSSGHGNYEFSTSNGWNIYILE